MSEQDLKFIKNLFASLDYDRMCRLESLISSIIENGEAYKKIEEFYSPIHDIAQFFINPQIDKKLGILTKVIPVTPHRAIKKFNIPLLKKGEIELWKVLSGAIKDTIKQTEYRVLDAMRKNGAKIGTVYDDDDVIKTNYPYEIRGDVLSDFIKFVINEKKLKIGDKVYLRFELFVEFERGILNDFNYKVYCEQVDVSSYMINFNSYELYHEYLLTHCNDIWPAHLSIYSSNGIDILYGAEDKNFEDPLTMHFLLKLPSFVVNYEQLIKIDQDRIKKQQVKKKQHQQTMQHLQSAGFNFGKMKKRPSQNPKGDLLEFSDAQTQQDQQTKQTQAYILKKIRQQNQRLLVDKLQDL